MVEYGEQAFTANIIDNRRIDFFTNKQLTYSVGDVQGTLALTMRARKIRSSSGRGIGSIDITGSSEKMMVGCAITSFGWTKNLNSTTSNGSTTVVEYDSDSANDIFTGVLDSLAVLDRNTITC